MYRVRYWQVPLTFWVGQYDLIGDYIFGAVAVPE